MVFLRFFNKLEKIIRHDEESLENNEDDGKSSQKRQSGRISNESQKLVNEVNKLRKEIVIANLDAKYLPNTKPHQEIWAPNGNIVENAREYALTTKLDINKLYDKIPIFKIHTLILQYLFHISGLRFLLKFDHRYLDS